MKMNNTTSDLSDTSVLLIMSDDEVIADMTKALKDLGATVHLARNRFDAVGMYWRLYSNNIIPRAVITKWWISPPGSDQYKFFESIGRLDDCTSLPVLRNAVKLDPTSLFIIYAKSVAAAKAGLKASNLSGSVFLCDRAKISADRLARAISSSEITTRYRLQKNDSKVRTSEIIDVADVLENIAEKPSNMHPAIKFAS
jgi:hypothetical protein